LQDYETAAAPARDDPSAPAADEVLRTLLLDWMTGAGVRAKRAAAIAAEVAAGVARAGAPPREVNLVVRRRSFAFAFDDAPLPPAGVADRLVVGIWFGWGCVRREAAAFSVR
jgi:hypothetical protein